MISVISAMALVSGMTGGVMGRERLVRELPISAGVFAAIGLPVNVRGLELQHLRSSIIDDGSQRILAVEGEVANIRSNTRKVPDIRISVRSKDGRIIYSWISPAPKKEIAVGESIYFRARLSAPPLNGQDVKAQFAAIEGNR